MVAALLSAMPLPPDGVSPPDEFRQFLQRGFELHQRGQYADALAALRRAWQIDPNDYFVNLLLGMDLLRTGERGKALPFLKQASRQRPFEEFPYEYLGEAEAGLAHYAEAAIAYRKAAELAPQSPQATMALVNYSLARFAAIARELRSSHKGLAAEYRLQALARQLHDPSRGDLLRRAAELDENAPGIWSEIAIVDVLHGDTAAAARDIERAIAKNPSDLRAWQAEALVAARGGNWERAAARLNAIVRRSAAALAQAAPEWPKELMPPQASVVSGPAAEFLRCVQDAPEGCRVEDVRARLPKPRPVSRMPAALLFREQRWEALAALTPGTSEPTDSWYFRGVALARTGDCDAAIPALERGRGAPAESVDAMLVLSWCYALQVGAVEKRVEQAGGDPVLLHIMRGDVLFRLQGNKDGAIAAYQAAVTARPQDAAALERLAEAQFGAGQIDNARRSAEAALRLDPHRLSATRTLAEMAMQERDYAVALPYLRQLASADPADITARVQLGTACAQTGALEEALRYLAPALQQGYPDEKGSLHYLLGTVLRRLGRGADATRAFETARHLSDAAQRTSHQEQDGRP